MGRFYGDSATAANSNIPACRHRRRAAPPARCGAGRRRPGGPARRRAVSFFKRQPEAGDRRPRRPVAQPHRVLARQPGLQRRQGDVRMGRDVRRHGGFPLGRQLARPVTAPRTGAHLPGPPPPDQRLVDVRHADPKHRRRRPRRHATVDCRQNPPPQVLRITLTLPPDHRCPQYLAVAAANHTFPCSGIPFSDSGQCGYALAQHYRFQPRACRPCRAKTKGKVERPFSYIRQDFFLGRSFRDLEDLNAQLIDWLGTVANVRVHGTTQRVVAEAFAAEQPELQTTSEETSVPVDSTGEIRAAQVFVAVMGASSYTYAEASWTQTLPDWIGSHVRALAFMGG